MAKKSPKPHTDEAVESKTKAGSDFDHALKEKRGKPTLKPGETTRKGTNSPEWYANSAQLLVDSASIPYSEALGTTIDVLSQNYSDHPFGTYVKSALPGVFTMYTAATLGNAGSDDLTSPINVAASNLYAWVRHANSGSANYERQDLMMYLLAMDAVYSYYSFLVRVYGVLNVYTQSNKYLPRGLIAGMHLDWNDLMDNLADFRYFINSSAVRIGSMCVPASMPYFARHMWLYQSVFLDTASAKGQVYQFSPRGFHIFTPYEDQSGGKLVFHKMWSSVFGEKTEWNFSDLRAFMEQMLGPIITNEDMNVMSGDVLKAFGDNGLFQIGTVPEDYIVVPLYDPEVLMQIQNATVFDEAVMNAYPSRWATWDIQQSTSSSIYQEPALELSSRGYMGPKLFTMQHDSPTAADTMVGSRLTVLVGKETTSSTPPASPDEVHWRAEQLNCASEVIISSSVCIYSPGATNKPWVLYPQLSSNISLDLGNSASTLVALTLPLEIEKFDWHPEIRLWGYNVSVSPKMWPPIFASSGFDVANYTVLDQYELRKMHDTAMLSMLAVPQMGSFGSKATAERR